MLTYFSKCQSRSLSSKIGKTGAALFGDGFCTSQSQNLNPNKHKCEQKHRLNICSLHGTADMCHGVSWQAPTDSQQLLISSSQLITPLITDTVLITVHRTDELHGQCDEAFQFAQTSLSVCRCCFQSDCWAKLPKSSCHWFNFNARHSVRLLVTQF